MRRLPRIFLPCIAAACLFACLSSSLAGQAPDAQDKLVLPKLLTQIGPHYPEEAKAQHLTGKVVLHFTITVEGDVSHITVVSGPEIFQQSAIDTVKQWKYQPAMKDGKPTAVSVNATINFT